jgi:hypothetical protein
LGANVSSFFKKKFGKEEGEFSALEPVFIPKETVKADLSQKETE